MCVCVCVYIYIYIYIYIKNCIKLISTLRRKYRKLSELTYCGVYGELIMLDVIAM